MDILRNYTFLPWTRRGFGAEIETIDDLAAGSAGPERASVSVSFNINGQPIAKAVEVLGPSDVVGINPRAVVKTDPRHLVTDFESNYLPYIEFYEEDFPWRFTPATAANTREQSRLRPWIFLVVLKEEEFVERKGSGSLAAFEFVEGLDSRSVFPPAEQSWAWAHVHVSRNIIGNSLQTKTDPEVSAVEQTLEQALDTNADVASSRLLGARKLEDNTAYHAFVVPAFETGRLAGLGLDIPPDTSGQRSSWDSGQRLYPIYYRWFFRTGTKGDFEFLVDLLEARPVDKRVGVRSMDMQNPGYEVEGMSGALRVMGLEGALKSTETESSPAAWPPGGTDFDHPPVGSPGRFLNQLEEKINLQFTLQQPESSESPHPDPIVSPPLHGKWYAMAERLDVRHGTGWVNELNRDPRLRTLAGAGTQAIQQDQERFMQQAWAQLGDLLNTNQKIRQFQVAWMTTFVTYQKNVLPQPTDQLLTFTHAVQSRILGSPTTIASQVSASRLPRAAIDPAFRKIARPRGAIMRKVVRDGAMPTAVLSQLNAGTLTAAPAPPAPTGQISLDGAASSIVPPSLPEWLTRLLRGRWLLIILVALIAIALVVAVISGVLLFGAIAVGFGVLLFAAWRLRTTVLTAKTLHEGFQEKSFTPSAVDRIGPRPRFVLTEFQAQMPPATSTRSPESVEAANFRVALKDAFNAYASSPPPLPIPPPLQLDRAVTTLKQALNPAVTIPKRALFVLKIPPSIKDSYIRPQETLVTVMAHPVFTEPMYRPLRDISAEFLAPNLGLIPNNTISLMQTNQRFIEAYMVGLNDEMGRELLWRQFPTDQRGSYFRQFWDVGDVVNREPGKTAAQIEEALLDITKPHTWGRETSLGTHASRPLPSGAESDEARLVLVVRGDLLKKYPTAMIYAQQAKWGTDEQNRRVRVLDDSNPAEFIRTPIFKAEIDPDVRFLGFDLTSSIVKGDPDPAANDPGWFFVIQERPGEPRFGLDNLSDESPSQPATWNDLAWEHLAQFESLGSVDVSVNAPDDTHITALPDSQFKWGRNAADMAYIFYQVPVMVAFHAADMLP